ncbi:hypothetical protein APUTEX25_000423 [Auxenochlorella protothecoides]|uniref:thiamine phosphate synthase n=1 Tax=Auxenochlorella protothecoides TaxID=3075 RepID=A0A3M7L0E9_AUXPR|nr:hypothetical protein APUTEX25_000423 [Auxenochlorella protothecoides]|eukprot:RMZ54906.1 hypothetical protein APUTEX25_000423 [Auxenochlorella protothecoides]
MQLEKEFFAGQPLNSQVRQLRLLVIDFDETITTRDTSGTIAKTAIQAVVSKVSEASKSEDLVQELADKHSWLIRNYTDRRTSLLEDALPPEGEVRTEFDMGWLGDFVDRLADFDREMNTVVVDSGILKGVRREQLAQAGAAVEMQPGSLAVMQKAVKAGIPVAVVSVSWSAEFVRAALAQQGLPVVVSDSDGQGADVPSVSAVTVYANELEYFGDERCECGADKARLLDDLLLGLAAEAGSGGDAVYVEVVMADVGAAAVKTGMLPDAASVVALAAALRACPAPAPALVLDPVLLSTTGDSLAQPGVEAMLREHLFPLATLITPNLPEAAALLGDGRAIVDLEGMRAAARELHALGPSWVLVKGGHLPAEARREAAGRGAAAASSGPEQPSRQQTVTDVLFDGRTMLELSEPLVVSDNVHGTGCCLATAIACELARGHSVLAAVRRAKRYLWRTLERSRGLPLGDGPQRTMNFGWATADWAADLAAAGVPMPPRVPNAADLRLYAITDPALNERAARSLIDAVRLAIDGGATLVQVRDKNSPARAFAAAAAEALEHARARGVPLVINDRLDVALAIGADGVHLGQDDLPAAAARRLLGPDRILGVSVKTPEQAARAAADGADYVGCGGFAPTNTKAGNLTVGPEGVAAVVRARVLPVVAIGGIGEGNASAALATGADGVAVISAIFGAPDVVRATKRLRAVVDAALTARGLSEGGEEA